MNKTTYALAALVVLLSIGLLVVGVKICNLQNELAEVRTEFGDNKKAVSDEITRLDNDLASSTNAIREEMNAGFAEQQMQIEQARQIQSNTISALTRLRKQKDELEKKLEEGLELRKQRLAEMRAWASGGGSSSSGGWSGIGGVFELTAYEWTGNPCANGEYPIPGYTVASNWFPIGTRIYIEGIGERVVTDTGGMSNNVIDIYMGDPEACYQFGRQTAEVYVIED